MRFSHFQPWLDGLGDGYSIFVMSDYSPSCAAAPTYCGFEWHKKDSAVPVGGFPTRALFYQPRLGAAYDLSGSGRTVLRGGWGRFYYHSGQFTSGLDASAGVKTATLSPSNWVGGPGCPTNPSTGSALFAAYLSCLNLAATPASPAAVDSTDNNQPYTDSWSFNVDRVTPWQGLLEISYVGNRSEDLQNTQGGAGSNINLIPAGTITTAHCHQSGIGEFQSLSPTPGLRRSESGDEQPVQQLQRHAGYLGSPCGRLYDPGELHMAEGTGHHQPDSGSFQAGRELRSIANRPQANTQFRVFHQSTQQAACQSIC